MMDRSRWMGMVAWALGCMFAVLVEAAPPTTTEAAQVIDLAQIPLLDTIDKPVIRRLAKLGYEANSSVRDAYAFHAKYLEGQKWANTDSTIMEEFASGTFARDGYRLALSITPSGPGKVSIQLTNLGNVPLDKLPLPKGAKTVYTGPAVAIYTTELPLEAAKAECRKRLAEQGWQEYGEAANMMTFKQNAACLNVQVAQAPAQQNQTSISYSTVLMSADLPPPVAATRLQYADTTLTLSFDSSASIDEVTEGYRKALSEQGWTPTTEKPLNAERGKKFWIFRNPGKDMLTLDLTPHQNQTRGSLAFVSAESLAEREAKRNK